MSHSPNINLLHTPKRPLPYANSSIWHYYSPVRSCPLTNEGMSKMSHLPNTNLLHTPKRALLHSNSGFWHFSVTGGSNFMLLRWPQTSSIRSSNQTLLPKSDKRPSFLNYLSELYSSKNRSLASRSVISICIISLINFSCCASRAKDIGKTINQRQDVRLQLYLIVSQRHMILTNLGING